MNNKEKRDVKVSFRCTKSEKELLSSQANKARMSLTDYILHLSNKKRIIVVEGIPELTKEINKIGVNINQACRIANQYSTISPNKIEEIRNQQSEILKALAQLIVEVNKKER